MRSLAKLFLLAVVLLIVGCGGSGHNAGVSNSAAYSATAASVEAQLSRAVTPARLHKARTFTRPMYAAFAGASDLPKP